VCPGTYNEDVVIPTALSLHGLNATIDAVPTNATMCDQLGQMGPGSAPCLAGVTIKSSNVEIDGFTVENAIGEGILATGSLAGGSISNVTITNNHVTGNDTGGIPVTTTSPYPQCNGFGQDPGDCGEGIHLMGVGNSVVSGNEVNGNSGGVLLTDEFGPTHDNVVEGNVVTENQSDCGITVPGHNPNALDAAGNPQPTVAGVYNNVIRGNVVTNNGLLGEGAGVLFANATAGTASYNNLVEGNYIAGNGLSGVTMHAHTLAPGQFEDLNGNQIIGNVIGTNNSAGDELDGPPAQDLVTTGVLVFSASVSTSVTIAHNLIFGNQNGVWLGINGHVSATIVHNLFLHNAVPVFTYS
jgi:parallel beta-helix repeat protein